MAWEAVRFTVILTAGACVMAWVGYTAMVAVFGGQPAPVPAAASPSSASAAVPKWHPSPAPHRAVVPASLAPVSAVPVRTRQPARTHAPSPAWTTPSATESPSPTPTPTPTPSVPSTASSAPSTATPTVTPTPPSAGSGT
jgi:hypothetical protein